MFVLEPVNSKFRKVSQIHIRIVIKITSIENPVFLRAILRINPTEMATKLFPVGGVA